MAVAASGSVRGGAGLETTEQTRAESDSLTLKNEELPPMLPGMFPFRNGYTPPDLSRLQPLEIPVFIPFRSVWFFRPISCRIRSL